jgi:hypothetical protein
VTNSLCSPNGDWEPNVEGFNRDDYHLLKPSEWGKFFRYTTPIYVIRMEGPEPIPEIPAPMTSDKRVMDSWKEEDRIWRSHHQPRMNIECSMETLARFTPEPFGYGWAKKVNGFQFAELADWIHTQTKGKWSTTVYGDKKKRPGHSWVILTFEYEEDAVLFKMFND